MSHDRVILHSDLNSFYASVEMLYNPKLAGKPVAVGGSVDLRHGIILAANPLAKKYGVRTGDAIWQAREKCGALIVVEPHMDRYVKHSKAVREIYGEYSPLVQPYGLDENWIDLTGTGRLFGSGAGVADTIRQRVKKELGVTVSIGVSFNKVFSKLGSDYKKPDAITVITKENYKDIVWPLPASDLLMVGRATTNKLRDMGIYTIGELAKYPIESLRQRFGKNGVMLSRFANGFDDEPVIAKAPPPKSVGNSTTTARDMETAEDIKINVLLLSESVAERLRSAGYKCNVVQVYIRYNDLAWYERQATLPFAVATAKTIAKTALDLILNNWSGTPLRSIGVRGCQLVADNMAQLSIFPELQAEQKQEDLERAVQDIRRRFGHFAIERASMLPKREFSSLNTRDENSAQSVAFFRG